MTDARLLVPAAQYLRMSTQHQQYSLENQSIAIQRYAESHGFGVVNTYSDAAAKSGVVIARRTGLRQLLQDVVSGTAPYKAILVYDVSRWGAFRTPTNLRITSSCASQRAYRCIAAPRRSRTMAHWRA